MRRLNNSSPRPSPRSTSSGRTTLLVRNSTHRKRAPGYRPVSTRSQPAYRTRSCSIITSRPSAIRRARLFGNTFTPNFKGGKFGKPQGPQVVLPPLSKKKSHDLVPQILLLTLINHPGIYPSVHESFLQLDPGQAELQRVYDALHDLLEGLEPEALDREAVLRHITALGLADIVDRLASERLYIHAGFARPDADPEKVLEGWKSFWGQWDNGRLRDDIDAARAALQASFTPENEDRILALQQIQMDKDTGTA